VSPQNNNHWDSDVNLYNATIHKYQPFIEYHSWSSHWEIFCMGHGNILHEVPTIFPSSVNSLKNDARNWMYQQKFVIYIKRERERAKTDPMILHSLSVQHVPNLRSCKGTSSLQENFGSTRICNSGCVHSHVM
jgi:hypothetical protein